MVVVIEQQVVIDDNFQEIGPRCGEITYVDVECSSGAGMDAGEVLCEWHGCCQMLIFQIYDFDVESWVFGTVLWH